MRFDVKVKQKKIINLMYKHFNEDLRKENGLSEQLSKILGPGEAANIKVINSLKMSELYNLI